MKRLLNADEYLSSYKELDLKRYARMGYSVFFLDIDNTLTPYYEEEPDEDVKRFLEECREEGFQVFLFSNNTKERVLKYARELDCYTAYMSLKPVGLQYERIIYEYHLDKNRIICIGDQLITDILGGNLRGLYTVHVKPVVEKDHIIGKITRVMEKAVFKINGHKEM